MIGGFIGKAIGEPISAVIGSVTLALDPATLNFGQQAVLFTVSEAVVNAALNLSGQPFVFLATQAVSPASLNFIEQAVALVELPEPPVARQPLLHGSASQRSYWKGRS